MSAFDSAVFDSAAFDAGETVDVYATRSISWRAVVVLGGVDVSDLLSGQLKVSAAEDSARTAEFFVTPGDAFEVESLSGQPVTVDYVISGNGGSLSSRRFTGSVVDWDFEPDGRIVTVTARDAYKETINTCQTQADVLALLGDDAVQCDAIAGWSDATPDPAGYFSQLSATAQGAYCISAAGGWQFVPWVITPPAAIFTAGDFFDETIKLAGGSKSDLPASITASLTVRVNRLCAVDVPLSWTGLDYQVVGRARGDWPPVQCVQSAMEGLSGWHIKGTPTMVHPQFSYTILTEGGGNAAMFITEPGRVCIGLNTTMHHRWYQTVDLKFSVDIPLGGMSDRDESISDSITSDWDAGAWESATSSDSANSIYASNTPAVSSEAAAEKTGYEGLPAPHPGINRAIIHAPDIGDAGLQSAADFVVAKAVRAAASGLRGRQVEFSRPIDPRFDVGDVLQVTSTGVVARGQVVGFDDLLDHDSGDATTTFTLACPAGNSAVAAWSASLTLPAATDLSAPASPVLSNFVGADTETPTFLPDSMLMGYLSNTAQSVSQYDAAAPSYVPQFRIVMPEIAAELRDPATIDIDLAATWSISRGIFEVSLNG